MIKYLKFHQCGTWNHNCLVLTLTVVLYEIQYHVIFDHVITAPDCRWKIFYIFLVYMSKHNWWYHQQKHVCSAWKIIITHRIPLVLFVIHAPYTCFWHVLPNWEVPTIYFIHKKKVLQHGFQLVKFQWHMKWHQKLNIDFPSKALNLVSTISHKCWFTQSRVEHFLQNNMFSY